MVGIRQQLGTPLSHKLGDVAGDSHSVPVTSLTLCWVRCGPGELARAPRLYSCPRFPPAAARRRERASPSIADNAHSVRGPGRLSRGRDWQRPAAPGARHSSPPPRQTKSGLGLGSWRPSRHLGRLGGGGCSPSGRRGLCLTPPLPPPARPRLGNPCAGGRAGGREG